MTPTHARFFRFISVHILLINPGLAFTLLYPTRSTSVYSVHSSLPDGGFFEFDEEESEWLENLSKRQFQQATEATQPRKKDEEEEEGDQIGGSQRKFRLGYDITLTSYMGSLGVDEMTDWEYYEIDGEDGSKGKRVIPFMDPNSPRRTRSRRGDAVRIFRGEFIGTLGQKLRSVGMDTRVLIKEFNLDEELESKRGSDDTKKPDTFRMEDLVINEIKIVTSLQTKLLLKKTGLWKEEEIQAIQDGRWFKAAAQRYVMGKIKNSSTQEDDSNLIRLLEIMLMLEGPSTNVSPGMLFSTGKKIDTIQQYLPMVGILGRLDLQDFFLDDSIVASQTWYKMFGKQLDPPVPNRSIWVVYEYPGYFSLESYARPALLRWINLPLQKGFWGNILPRSTLPSWQERSKYVAKGILKSSLEALATLHENGIAHRSIGKNSILISTMGSDKLEASSPFTVNRKKLKVQFVDFGFAGMIQDTKDASLRSRARAFNVFIDERSSASIDAINFSMAEDLHALGFVFIAVLLTSLADISEPTQNLPPTDEDSLQRLLSDIFDKNINEFRDYCEAEEAWSKVVALLDENDRAGWELLQVMCFARERAANARVFGQMNTARGLLSSPFFLS